MNSPEGELFHKSAVLYGLHLARQTMAKDDRAVIVEGNTDVIALRQAGMSGVVASMGTALTEAQLKEVGRLTRSVFLCFDADAAGEEATLRGMQLAASRGLEVWVVALDPGTDPADDPGAFAARLASAEKYPLYRVRVEIDRALPDRQAAHQRVRQVLDPLPDGPDRHDAWQYANDRLGMTVQLQASVSASAGVLTGSASARVLTASAGSNAMRSPRAWPIPSSCRFCESWAQATSTATSTVPCARRWSASGQRTMRSSV